MHGYSRQGRPRLARGRAKTRSRCSARRAKPLTEHPHVATAVGPSRWDVGHDGTSAPQELEPGAAEQPDSRGKNFLHTAIIKGDLESLLFLISINVNVNSKTTDSNKLAPILLAVQV